MNRCGKRETDTWYALYFCFCYLVSGNKESCQGEEARAKMQQLLSERN